MTLLDFLRVVVLMEPSGPGSASVAWLQARTSTRHRV